MATEVYLVSNAQANAAMISVWHVGITTKVVVSATLHSWVTIYKR